MIEVKQVTKRYGEKVALKGINFKVGKGEIIGFLGPNGAGKTTTMQIITGYIPPTSGEVKVGGFDTFKNPLDVKRLIGYLPENPPLYPNMTVYRFLKFIAELKDIPRDQHDKELDRVMEVISIKDVRNRLIKNLSKGYKQRVGLAQALIGDPEVLILDEPTSGLDPRQIIEIRNLIKALSTDKTIILSSHILPEVNMIAERVLIINEGEIVAQDTPSSLSRRLRHGEVLQVEIDGDKDQIKKEIEELDGVKQVDLKEGKFNIETGHKGDVRRNLFFKMAELGYPILEMKTIDLSLEEIFLQLTTEEEEVLK
ncbi:ABC transporter ATP-binding protein [Halothermothrix orenii]|uniref:ABC transporter related n=1 Tax=Halothermothrix orenii (strain H 168 / OCM 544 / DSM 9562) TaxID=373903 RepID=B8CXN2_HALOH|nr:ABC transporter ATP-binding protein [Halothermothrix orenii]ACL70051.1 ABC transporter related [Halothermothrix orenii H 168]